MFADLQDAMDWGLSRLGGNAFRVKYMSIAQIESEESPSDHVVKVRELMHS